MKTVTLEEVRAMVCGRPGVKVNWSPVVKTDEAGNQFDAKGHIVGVPYRDEMRALGWYLAGFGAFAGMALFVASKF